jgi:pimeloyl-ACP methyl ester carboxylesterase
MKLHFREMGQGTPLLILHGLFGSSDNWLTIAKQLAASYHVFIIDQRNHGQSPHSNIWNYTVMAQDIEDFCIQHQLNEIYIVGHSMGGKTVMKLAELFPKRIKKMMVIDIAPRYYPVHHHQILNALKSIDFNIVNTRKQAEEVLHNAIEDFGTRQFLLKNIYWIDENKLAWRFNLEVIANHIEIVGETTPPELTAICEIPVCFVKGEKSDYIKKEDEQLIASQFSNSEILTIANAGHWVHAENPTALLNLINYFFN